MKTKTPGNGMKRGGTEPRGCGESHARWQPTTDDHSPQGIPSGPGPSFADTLDRWIMSKLCEQKVKDAVSRGERQAHLEEFE